MTMMTVTLCVGHCARHWEGQASDDDDESGEDDEGNTTRMMRGRCSVSGTVLKAVSQWHCHRRHSSH